MEVPPQIKVDVETGKAVYFRVQYDIRYDKETKRASCTCIGYTSRLKCKHAQEAEVYMDRREREGIPLVETDLFKQVLKDNKETLGYLADK